MALTWSTYRFLENSLVDKLNTTLVSGGILDVEGRQIVARVGRKEDNNWVLPCISVYLDSVVSPKEFVGSNVTLDVNLLIIDIYATNEGERLDLAKWVYSTIRDGFRFYSYTYNASSPATPTTVAGRWIHVNFISNTRVALGQNVEYEDAHRHRISIDCDINGS